MTEASRTEIVVGPDVIKVWQIPTSLAQEDFDPEKDDWIGDIPEDGMFDVWVERNAK